ncbi:hypothetical protein NW762_012791 [Fusarium torreyae]|uniref:Alcohol dehydrogenase-like C-terminal domain-containing protein n=1 Tax=Fusarium torreyae TaxID=1237075 RepID=A0A9W8RPY5_9HYPO|nr:hypothetical protein NW762_012791 [Fusarium torreyae]
MCDIFPTGYYGAMRAITFLERPLLTPPENNGQAFGSQPMSESVFVVFGCGPVGLCALLTAKTKGVGTVYAVDSVDERLDMAQSMGCVPLKLGRDDVVKAVMEATDGRGADAAVEVVGNAPALKSAFEVVRQCGVLSSIGYHHGAELPFSAAEAYQKNITLSMGRAAVSSLFDEALGCLMENQARIANFVSHNLPLSEASKGYDIFEKHQARKVVFKIGEGSKTANSHTDQE